MYFKTYISLLFLLFVSGCKSPEPTQNTVNMYWEFDDFWKTIDTSSDTTYIINFWATTCPPCIREMPLLEKITPVSSSPTKVILVSLDRAKDHNRLLPFIDKHQLNSPVLHLTDPKKNVWTAKIDSSWYGALPATLFVHKNNKAFHFGAFEKQEDITSILSHL